MLRFMPFMPFISLSMLAFRGLVIALLLLLQACGGSSGSSGGNSDPPLGNLNLPLAVWNFNQFEPSENFENYCEKPRSGVSLLGKPYPDKQGSSLLEKHWLRSWSHETYLWYDEIIDQDPSLFATPEDYFESLKTTATTASGKDKDQFHFAVNTADNERLRVSGTSVGYGMEFKIIRTRPPREIRIIYVEANSPAARAGIQRGDKIIAVDGVSIEQSLLTQDDVDILNNGLFPSQAGQVTRFEFQRAGLNTPLISSLQATQIYQRPVQTISILQPDSTQPDTRVGYLHLTSFGILDAEQQLYDAFNNFLADGIQDLVLDLRYNSGGYLFIASQLAYMIAGAKTTDKNFGFYKVNDKLPPPDPVPFIANVSTPNKDFKDFALNKPLPSLNLERVFILTTNASCSASEAVINGLRGIDIEVILIGAETCGKPYGFSGADNCGTTYYTVQFQLSNHKGFGEYADGFRPSYVDDNGAEVLGCLVSDDYQQALGNPNEALLKTALYYRSHATCPAESFAASSARLEDSGHQNQQQDALSRMLQQRQTSRQGLILYRPTRNN